MTRISQSPLMTVAIAALLALAVTACGKSAETKAPAEPKAAAKAAEAKPAEAKAADDKAVAEATKKDEEAKKKEAEKRSLAAKAAEAARKAQGAAQAAKNAAAACKKDAPVPTAADTKDPSKAVACAPEEYKVKFETTAGDFTIAVHRAWAPNGADRFWNLVHMGFYNDVAFFRVLPNFVAQFGLSGDPDVNRVWRDATIPDDPVTQKNKKGSIVFATRGKDTRTTQLFVNYRDNLMLDRMGFAPFGEVTAGMDVVEKLFGGYGEGAPRGKGPNQMLITTQGNTYLKKDFPKLDYVKKATIEK
jgi:peptidyl-prolyl cis-trans isomerase A (cyclophilin A)